MRSVTLRLCLVHGFFPDRAMPAPTRTQGRPRYQHDCSDLVRASGARQTPPRVERRFLYRGVSLCVVWHVCAQLMGSCGIATV